MRESEISANPVDVGIHGDHQLRWRDRPEPEIDPIGRPNHPTGVEHESLAGAARAWVADQVARASVARVSSKRICEAREALSEVRGVPVDRGKSVPERSVFTEQPSRSNQHGRQVLATVDPMLETTESLAKLALVGRANQLRWLRTQRIERSPDARSGGNDVSERQAGRHEADHLLVLLPIVVMHEPYGIVVGAGSPAGE